MSKEKLLERPQLQGEFNFDENSGRTPEDVLRILEIQEDSGGFSCGLETAFMIFFFVFSTLSPLFVFCSFS